MVTHRINCLAVLFFLIGSIATAQNSQLQLQNYHPTSPTAFEFLKYTEMPVSEYTGIPNISIPLYQIEMDGVSIPFNLTYHAAGIRVNQEASWVGLGWDLSLGSIVQEINDRDDYAAGITRLKPDWNESPIPSLYSQKYANVMFGILNYGWNDPVPVNSPTAGYYYSIFSSYPVSIGVSGTCHWINQMVAYNYYLPIAGNRDNQPTATDLVDAAAFDSEPDIFTANFLGHSIKFMRNSQNANQIRVLNNPGYLVSRSGEDFIITTPAGDKFYFELNSPVSGYSSSYNPEPNSSRIWMITKLVTRYNNQVLFNYSQSGVSANYPSFSQTADYQLSNTFPGGSCSAGSIPNTLFYSSENRFYLSSIVFPSGTVSFSTSARNDVLGGKKLDQLQVISTENKIIKSYQFNYSYTDASGIGGNVYTPNNSSSYGNTPNLRMMLLSFQDNAGGLHNFTYNTTALPAKNSLAQDFWGFYNGQLSNTTLVPNPARLNSDQLEGATGLPDNGTNNSANFTYTQAAILTAVKYPTGGSIGLEYELNQFDNYWVPDFNTTSNQLSSGNGLRIHAINYKASDNTVSKRTLYTYTAGKAMVKIQLGRTFYKSYMTSDGYLQSCTFLQLNSKGFYSSSSLSSGSGVGYSMVTKQDVDNNGVSLGKTETYFNNNPDKFSSSGYSELNIVLPTVKNPNYPQNGTVSKVKIFDNQDHLQRMIENFYPVGPGGGPVAEYGARFYSYTPYLIHVPLCDNVPAHNVSLPRTLVGYYPIYDVISNVSSTTTTDYDNNNNAVVSTVLYNYDANNQVSMKLIKNGVVEEDIYETYEYALDYYVRTGNALLYNSHRFAEPTAVRRGIYRVNQTGPHFYMFEQINNDYASFSGTIAMSSTSKKKEGEVNPRTATYDQYDNSGNLLQLTHNGITNSLIWDYNKEYVTAEVTNGSYQNIAFSSFEADGTGNWTYSGSTADDNTAPTGKKVYTITGNNVTRSGVDPAKSFVVSYWSKNGAMSVNGTTGSVGRTFSGWTYYEHSVVNPPGGTITVSGTGQIDELRLYPQGALMTTYTYSPLIGMKSQCDPNSRIQYYDYDAANRLGLILDQDKNILKKICYNYAGQPENCAINCPVPSYPAWQNTSTPLRCEQGSCGNTGFQEQEQIDTNPCSSTYNQIRWVQAGYNTTACPLGTCVNLTSTVTNGAPGYTATYYNTATGITYTFPVPAMTGLQPLGTVPTGTYNITIQRTTGIPMQAVFKPGCGKFVSATGTSATFNNIVVTTTSCNSISIEIGVE